MNTANVARNYKDRLFVRLFGDKENKKNLLSLYNALNGTEYTDETALDITTIEGVVYMGMKNDVSCILDNTMALYEHQSSYNPNMPLRGFLYAGKLYDKYVVTQDISIYGDTLIALPTPQYYVFYNGTDEMKTEDRIELRLSDAFGDPTAKERYEWTAIMLNINCGRNRELMKKCSLLREYSMCVDTIREFTKMEKDWKNAIRKAVDECIQRGILADFLRNNKAEVVDMLLTEYDEQKLLEQYRRRGYEAGTKNGCAIGIKMSQFVTEKLLEAKRYEDLERAVKDPIVLRTFAEEFGFETENQSVDGE
ncbi:MAG: hypothetical protein IJ468_07500 [Lachnospiraceae bacterium]|nr:hypothetical protein [Lachnospiraceae bacterium]